MTQQTYRATLVENASATGSAVNWPGGRLSFGAKATWSGGTVKVQCLLPSNDWVDVSGLSLTADGMVSADVPAGQIRASIATATAVYAYAFRVPV